jgi:hypothetical protein
MGSIPYSLTLRCLLVLGPGLHTVLFQYSNRPCGVSEDCSILSARTINTEAEASIPPYPAGSSYTMMRHSPHLSQDCFCCSVGSKCKAAPFKKTWWEILRPRQNVKDSRALKMDQMECRSESEAREMFPCVKFKP